MTQKYTKKADYIILFSILFTIFFNFLFYEHYPLHDEVKSTTLLSSLKTTFIKFQAHNHFITTQIGNIIIYLFGVDLVKLRMISLISFFGIIYLTQKKLGDISKTYIVLLIYFASDIIITYYSMYRGYAFSAFIFTYIFFLINENENRIKNFKIIYIITSILIFHNQSTLLLIIPILISISILLIKEKNKFNLSSLKIIFIYFFIPFICFLFFFSFIEGIYAKKLFVYGSDIKKFLNILTNNFFSTFYVGFNSLFFNEYTTVSLYGSFNNLIILIKNNILIFIIFALSFVKSTYSIFFIKRNANTIDYIILLFFIIFFVLNKNPPARVYTGLISFFIIYCIKDIDLNLLKLSNQRIKLILKYLLLTFVVLNLLNIEFIRTESLKKEYIFFSKKVKNCEFPSSNKNTEFDKHMEYYVYLHECKKKPVIDLFYRFYKH